MEATLDNITNLNRPGQDGYATIWDGNKYVQCRRLPDRSLRCESAGALIQSSLEHVLTPERTARLTALGWRLDPSFGNYVQVFPADAASSLVADKIIRVLREAYDADVADLDVQSTCIRSEPCPPRNGPSQNLAGIVNNALAMAATAVHACAYKPKADLGPSLPAISAGELIGFYGAKVTAEIQRLRVNARRDVFAAFEAGIGYVQCRRTSCRQRSTAKRNRRTVGRRSQACSRRNAFIDCMNLDSPIQGVGPTTRRHMPPINSTTPQSPPSC
jgi:hypothetical protein